MKKIKNIILSLMVVMLSAVSFEAGAQQRNVTIKGTVMDEHGEPLAGASIQIENVKSGVIADADGKYTIRVRTESSLIYSFIGYKSKKIYIANDRPLDVMLEPDQKVLDEVVVVGYGTMKKRDLTGSVASVSSKSIENYKSSSVLSALGGMVAGVNITSNDGAPGAGFDIKIRGVGTVTGDSSPLFIVDGFEASTIDDIANNDIKSIEVLKDASACAIYGARAANGVVLVTTKSGQIGRTRIEYNGSASYRTLAKYLDVMTPYEFVDLQMEINPLKFEGLYFKPGFDNEGNEYRYHSLEDYKGVEGIDWQKEAFRPTWSQNHDVSVSGGSKKTQFIASFSHYDEDGLFITNSYEKNSARLKLNQELFKWLRFSTTVTYTNIKRNGVGTGSGALNNILMYRPVGGLRTSLEELRYNLQDPILDQLGVSNDTYYNPIVNAENTQKDSNSDKLNAYANLRLSFNKYLSFSISGNFSLEGARSNIFYKNGTSTADRGSGPYGSSQHDKYMRYGITNQLTYNRTFARKHKVNLILGHETSSFTKERLYGEAKDFPLDELGTDNLGLGAVPSAVNSSKAQTNRLSFFGRAFYGYDDRYLITATVRGDASSVFSEKHKWGCFPSFSAAWNISNEKWLKNVRWISNLKLRAGWGMVGNDRITNYLSLALFDNNKYGVGSQQVTTLTPSHLPNKDLKWEASMTTNVGLDMGFFNDRLNIVLDGFIKDSKDLLLKQDLTLVTGFESQWQNVGKIRNKGIELSISSINFNKRNFSWTTDFNISFIKNELMSLQSGKSYMLSRSGINSSFSEYDYIAEVGKPIGSMYGYVFDGVYQSSDFETHADGTTVLRPGITDISQHAGKPVAPGFIKYKDLNGDGIITPEDRTAIGNGQPDFYGGMTNTFLFYGVDLSFMLQYNYGNDVYNAQRMFTTQSDLEMMNMSGEVRNRWRVDNASNKVPSAKGYIRNDVCSRFIEDGSFLRLKNITIGYTFPEKWMRRIYVSKLRVYASADNLFCLTKYSGYDPEVSMRTSNLMPSFDYGSYPRSRVWTFGLQLNF